MFKSKGLTHSALFFVNSMVSCDGSQSTLSIVYIRQCAFRDILNCLRYIP